jgi:hypothetical protein
MLLLLLFIAALHLHATVTLAVEGARMLGAFHLHAPTLAAAAWSYCCCCTAFGGACVLQVVAVSS